jgi:hypothetical protein
MIEIDVYMINPLLYKTYAVGGTNYDKQFIFVEIYENYT